MLAKELTGRGLEDLRTGHLLRDIVPDPVKLVEFKEAPQLWGGCSDATLAPRMSHRLSERSGGRGTPGNAARENGRSLRLLPAQPPELRLQLRHTGFSS